MRCSSFSWGDSPATSLTTPCITSLERVQGQGHGYAGNVNPLLCTHGDLSPFLEHSQETCLFHCATVMPALGIETERALWLSDQTVLGKAGRSSSSERVCFKKKKRKMEKQIRKTSECQHLPSTRVYIGECTCTHT